MQKFTMQTMRLHGPKDTASIKRIQDIFKLMKVEEEAFNSMTRWLHPPLSPLPSRASILPVLK